MARSAEGSTVLEVRRMHRPRTFAITLIVVLLAGAIGGAAWAIHWVQTRPLPRAEIESSELPRPWSTGYSIVPDSPPPASPMARLERRIDGFKRTVEHARAAIEPPRAAFGAEALTAEIERALAPVGERAEVSVHVRDLESSRILFDYHGDELLNPASNNKLLTGAAALHLLGADYVFETRVLQIDDALWVIGEGDPTLDGDALRALVREVAKEVAIETVTRIVVDDSAFSDACFAPGYHPEWTDEAWMAPSGALSLAFNSVEVTVAPVGKQATEVTIEPPSTHVILDNQAVVGKGRLSIRSLGDQARRADTRISIEGAIASWRRGVSVRRRVADPGAFTGGALAAALAEATQTPPLPVEFGKLPKSKADAAELIVLRRSPPLIEVVTSMLAWSNNLIAEQLVRTLGWRMTGAPGDWAEGCEVVREYWQAIGEDPDMLIYENGSGLSRAGRVSTRGLVDLIAVTHRTQPRGSSLIDALPVAGAEGTLRGRLRRSGKRVRAKTGTMSGVSGLTGVITNEAGEPRVAFSIIINVRESGRMYAESRREIEDAIVMAVLGHIDNWEVVRGEMIDDLEPLEVSARPAR